MDKEVVCRKGGGMPIPILGREKGLEVILRGKELQLFLGDQSKRCVGSFLSSGSVAIMECLTLGNLYTINV